jgi:hypothetical protein
VPLPHLLSQRSSVYATVDDDEALNLQPNPSLGEISVTVQPVIVTAHYQRKQPQAAIELSTGKVHERSKKAGVHSVGYILYSPALLCA